MKIINRLIINSTRRLCCSISITPPSLSSPHSRQTSGFRKMPAPLHVALTSTSTGSWREPGRACAVLKGPVRVCLCVCVCVSRLRSVGARAHHDSRGDDRVFAKARSLILLLHRPSRSLSLDYSCPSRPHRAHYVGFPPFRFLVASPQTRKHPLSTKTESERLGLLTSLSISSPPPFLLRTHRHTELTCHASVCSDLLFALSSCLSALTWAPQIGRLSVVGPLDFPSPFLSTPYRCAH